MTVAITEAITTLAEAERRFNLTCNEDEGFFTEWQRDFLSLVESDQMALHELRRRYLFQV